MSAYMQEYIGTKIPTRIALAFIVIIEYQIYKKKP